MTITELGEAISNSLSYSSILVLTALGLAITFGVMRVINMAHGEMLMLGAYTAFVITDPHYLPKWIQGGLNQLGYDTSFPFNLFLAIPLSFLVVGFIGYLMEVLLIRYLYGRPLDTLLATWGVGLILQQLININFGANLQPMHLPDIFQPERFQAGQSFSVIGASTLGLLGSPVGQGPLISALALVP